MSELTQAIMRYKETGCGFEEIRARLFLIIYDYPRISRRLDPDVCGDFLMYMMQRIEPIIERYRFESIDFEGYFNVCLKWRLKSFLREQANSRTRSAREVDPYIWQDINRLAYAAEPATEYGPAAALTSAIETPATEAGDPVTERIREFNAGNKGFLFFCLKAICDVDDARIPSVANLCGVSSRWLTDSRDILVTKTGKRRKRLARLRKRQETLYSRLRDAEERLAIEPELERKSELRKRIRKLSEAYRRASHEAAHTSLRPSNTDIAELLHVPKGTVDSGITRARQVLTSSLQERETGRTGAGDDPAPIEAKTRTAETAKRDTELLMEPNA